MNPLSEIPLTVLVTFRIKAGRDDHFLAILLPHLRRVADEANCMSMFVHRDVDDPTRFMLFEQWRDRDEFLDVQMHRAYRVPYNEALTDLEAEPRKVTLWAEVPIGRPPDALAP